MIELVFVLLGLGSTELAVTVRDAATGKPVDGAFVVAREFMTVGKFHGSTTTCIRADVAKGTGPRVAMQLRHAGTDSFSGTRAIEAFAYHPGYCVARTDDGRAASMALYGPSYAAVRPKGIDPSVETRLDLRRAAQSSVDRLLYLGDLAEQLVCGEPRWSDRGRDGIERLSSAMVAEAQPLARSRYERDAQGVTALQGFVGALKPAEVKVLLEAGADPSIASRPSDVAPIETLVERMARTQPDTGTAKDALEILEMLAAHPKVTLSRKLRDDLAADPATWTAVQHSPGRKLLVEARPRLLELAPRAEDPGACAPLGSPRYEYSALPIRLRHP